jgi:hypothetical protein
MKIRFLVLGLALGFFVSGYALLPVFCQEAAKPAESPQETKAQEEKEPEAVEADEALKQMEKAKQELGYTKEEYEEYQKALALTDAKEKSAALLLFMKAHPNCKLNENAVANIPPLLSQLYQEKKMAELIPTAASYLEIRPDDLLALGVMTEATYTTKDYANAAKYGEILYGKKPTPQVAQLLAHSYMELKNDVKFASYAEKCLPEMNPKDGFYFSAKLSYYYAERKDLGKAALYCQKMVSAFGEGEMPAGYSAAQWNVEKGRSYAIMGRNYYERKQNSQAVSAFNNSLKAYPQNDEVYYYLGMSYWQLQDINTAMKNFAKAVAMNKSYAKSARNYLEGLFKATHNGSLEGLEALLKTAAAEMR